MNHAKKDLENVKFLFFNGIIITAGVFINTSGGLKMSDLSQVAVYSDSADIYKVRDDDYSPSIWIMFVSIDIQ